MAEPAPDEPRYPCKVCGRKFVQASLEKHENACKTLQKKKRKVFDSGKQRASGETDVSLNDVRKAQKELAVNAGTFQPPKTKWREKHEQFQEGLKSSKNVGFALKTGSPLPPPPTSKVPSDYVECEYCGRNFNQNAAERHIPFCKQQLRKKGPSFSNGNGPPKPSNRSQLPSRSISQPPKPGGKARGRSQPLIPSRAPAYTPSPPDSRSPSPPMPRRRGNSYDRGPPRRYSREGDGPRRLQEVKRPTRLPQPQPNHIRRQSPANRMIKNQRRY